MLKIVFLGLIFIFGLNIGSFLNCVIYRLEWKKSFLKGRSFCPKCGQILQWYDLVPVLSFAFLKGRCRYCKNKISWQYPAVEITTGLLFLIIFSFHYGAGFSIFEYPNIIELFYLFIIASLLIIIFVYDLKHYIIPSEAVFLGVGVVFLYRFFEFFNFYHWNLSGYWLLVIGILKNLAMPMIAGISAGAFFFLIWLVSNGKWMGFGDVILAFFMGIFLSFPNILAGLLTAFFSGSLVGLALMFFGKKTLKSAVPFGPFLIFGTFLALFLGDKIIHLYLNFLII